MYWRVTVGIKTVIHGMASNSPPLIFFRITDRSTQRACFRAQSLCNVIRAQKVLQPLEKKVSKTPLSDKQKVP